MARKRKLVEQGSKTLELEPGIVHEAQAFMRKPKTPISIRIDNDVLEWFRSQGDGYQSLVNAVLRSYMEVVKKRG